MPRPKKYFHINITVYRDKIYRCSAKGIIDWTKTVEYSAGSLRILLETNHKIKLVRYGGSVGREVDKDQKDSAD